MQNYVTFETDFGPERTMYWHGVDFTLNARLRQGLTLQFGTQTGRSSEDTCETARNDRRNDPTTIKDLRNCRDVDPFQTTIRGLASYTIPKVDVLVSGTVRSQPAIERIATWAVPNTLIQSAIGRLPPGGVATGNTSVEHPGQRSSAVRRRSADADRHAIREDLPIRREARWTSAWTSATC